jgi:benzodiazapine receptor
VDYEISQQNENIIYRFSSAILLHLKKIIMEKYKKSLIFVATCVGIGYLSGTVTQSSVTTWFPTLIKPSFNPPSWVFAPVWSMLYIMMGIAAGLVWNRIDHEKEVVKKALLFFAIQLAL